MAPKKIMKLLASLNVDDVKLGWEYLEKKGYSAESKKWWAYLDVISIKSDQRQPTYKLEETIINDLYPRFFENSLWKRWSIHNTKWKNLRK